MRTLLLASAALLALGGTGFAQNAAGNPRSAAASNITASDTHSELAPALPSAGTGLTANQYLQSAEQALRSRKTGLAQSSLENAETLLLTRSVPQGQGATPDNGPRIAAITRALHALAARDMQGAMSNTQEAMNGGGMGEMNGTGGMNSSMPPGASSSMQTPMPGTNSQYRTQNNGQGGYSNGANPSNPANGAAQSTTNMPNGMNNNPAGLSGGGGNESSGPAQ